MPEPMIRPALTSSPSLESQLGQVAGEFTERLQRGEQHSLMQRAMISLLAIACLCGDIAAQNDERSAKRKPRRSHPLPLAVRRIAPHIGFHLSHLAYPPVLNPLPGVGEGSRPLMLKTDLDNLP